jgi:ABC-type branched-subunit amino acid transport system permease subunit
MKKAVLILTACSGLLFGLGAWSLIFLASSIAAKPPGAWFTMAIAVFAMLSLLASILIWMRRWSWAMLPLVPLLVMSVLRWVTNWRYVFPFGEPGLAKTQPSFFLEFWQSQQFASVLIVGVTALLALYVANRSKE